MISNHNSVGCVRSRWLEKSLRKRYDVGDRVLFHSFFKLSGIKSGDKVPGTVISVFEAQGIHIHRIELDIKNATGQKTIVGNVHNREITPIQSPTNLPTV